MPCLSKISNIYPTLTETEKRIADFISSNEVPDINPTANIYCLLSILHPYDNQKI